MVEVNLFELIVAFVAAMGIPSAITGFCIRRLEKKMEKHQKDQENKEAAKRNNELMIIEGMNAAIALSEATARAVQRIPDAKCNGDMHAALEYATHIKQKHKDFITKQGVDALY